MLPFLLDELIVFALAVVTLRATKMQERHGRLLKLVAGTTMLALAGTVLVRPETMNDPVEATLVFVAAFAVAGLVHLLVQLRDRRQAADSWSPPLRRDRRRDDPEHAGHAVVHGEPCRS